MIRFFMYSKTNKMHQCIKFILFLNDTLHVSDGLSVHHQEFKTVQRQQAFVCYRMYSLEFLITVSV